MGTYWERGYATKTGTGDMTFEPGTSTVGLIQAAPPLTGTIALRRVIITGQLAVTPDGTSPLLDPGWPGHASARMLVALQDPAAGWITYQDIANENVLGRSTMIITPIAPNAFKVNGAAIWQTSMDIDLRGERLFTDYPETPVLRVGGNWASLDLIAEGGLSAVWTWHATASILWGT